VGRGGREVEWRKEWGEGEGGVRRGRSGGGGVAGATGGLFQGCFSDESDTSRLHGSGPSGRLRFIRGTETVTKRLPHLFQLGTQSLPFLGLMRVRLESVVPQRECPRYP